ncbi:MAG: fumarate hydratase [Erysipelotrichaceae bacterium]|nr:fumarate hydratase [Erysipelotrichaceae bacterium]
MKEINVRKIEDAIASMCSEIAVVYNRPIRRALEKAKEAETGERASAVMEMLIENAEIAEKENIPICQDTGMAIVLLKIGQEVHLCGGSLNEAVNRGVERGYGENYLRASVVADPLYERKNTKTNTPAVIYTEITEGEEVEIEIMAKGFGSENKSAVKMLTPADGEKGVIDFVVETVKNAGPNACPPFVIGVGIGGTFDYCAVLSKKALLRNVDEHNPDEKFAKLEEVLLNEINALNIGPMGFHGKTTALAVQIEQAPTHIAGMPVAVNVCCHVCRHAKAVIR